MRFLDAAAVLYNYFDPIPIQVTLDTPRSMSVLIRAPDAKKDIRVTDISCGTSITATELFEIIQEIERQISLADHTLFEQHTLYKLRAKQGGSKL